MFSVAVVGATGAVGTTMLSVLEERGFPVSKLVPLASERSAGRELDYLGQPREVRELRDDSFEGVDIALFSAGSARSKSFAPAAVEAGAVVIDNSSAYRMDPKVPLVVPVVALKPLAEAAGLERVVISSYQAVSGTGAAAVDELRSQTAGYLSEDEPAPDVYPHPIAFNAIPHIDVFDESGYTGEERKVRDETRKMLGMPDLRLSATCVRVPVMHSHSEAVHIETVDPLSADEARSLLMGAPGVVLVDEPALNSYPLPRDAAGRDDVMVGRIRDDDSHPRGLAMWIVADNLRKGAASNAVQIAESLVTKGWL
jgi:aspartate-semialdehyde dehydrogenase